ncbi:MAG: hypothetical protein JXR73_04555 [Candidatus Omnitrophica bacterium]|nr:hypothetical protein [Candidatus Omnitrophota bacterium]
MKSTICQIIFITLILSLCVQAGFAQKQDAEGNQLIEAPFTSIPPTIDGVLNPGEWDMADSNTVDFENLGIAGEGLGETDGPEDIQYTFSVMYDSDYLYVGVSVTDDVYVSDNFGKQYRWDLPVTWANDAVEYFFDGDLSRSESSARNAQETETGGQWIYGTDSDASPDPFISPELYGEKVRPYGTGPDDVWYAKTFVNEETADWSQEARFSLDIIGSPSPGREIGFNIAVDDVDVYDEQTLDPEYWAEFRDIQLYWTAYLYDPGMTAEDAVHELEWLWGTLRFLESTDVWEWPLY